MIKDKKKKVNDEAPKKIMTTRERMLQRKRDFESKKSTGIEFVKEGTMRVRLVSQGPDDELGLEVIQFYLGKDMGGVISPATFDEPCPFMEKYKELKESDDEDDQRLAGLLVPRRRYIICGTIYKDEKGKEIDTEKICKPILVPRSVYQDIIDLYLDEDDWGDMTDPEDGYDIKITRSGSGKNDTTYSVTACPKRGSIDPKYVKPTNLSDIIRKQVKSYEDLEEQLNEFISGPSHDVEEIFSDTKEAKKSKSKDKKKKKKSKE